MRGEAITRPCEFCGAPITRTKTQHGSRKEWTCNRSCTFRLHLLQGKGPHANDPNYTGTRETRPCVVCGKPVTRLVSQRKGASFWTCSRTCLGTYSGKLRAERGDMAMVRKPRKGDTIPCVVCGTPVYRNKGQQIINKRFCSTACANIAQTKTPVIKQCPTCGKEMRLKPSQAVRIYCSRLCEASADIKRPLDRLHNGRPAKMDNQGYVMVWEPSHPNKAFHGWQYEHRLVAEAALDRYLRSDEHVHHKNGIKHDNDAANLEVMDGIAHAALSARDYRDKVKTSEERLAEYERRFGPLT